MMISTLSPSRWVSVGRNCMPVYLCILFSFCFFSVSAQNQGDTVKPKRDSTKPVWDTVPKNNEAEMKRGLDSALQRRKDSVARHAQDSAAHPRRGDTTVPGAVAKDSGGLDTSGVGPGRVTGTVALGGGATDLSGTSVEVKGSGKGIATTNAEGHFSIRAPDDAVLVFSHVGYLTTEVDVKGKAMISVSLNRDANTLEQVTVSYGKQAKRELSSAVTKVDAADVADIPATEFG